jgi:6-pyruvoyltetrahydropterin/6-carboxytetrahydropterin synthase
VFALARTVRFSIAFDDSAPMTDAARAHNTFAGHPSLAGLGAYYELRVTCCGAADPVTGYVRDIASIDDEVRRVAIPFIHDATRTRPSTHPGVLLRELVPLLQRPLEDSISAVTWQLTPHYGVTLETTCMDRVLLRQHFSFAASHRLHVDALPDEENRAIFGKCNNRHGHGHNYRLEVSVSVPLESPPPLTLPGLERIVDEQVVRRFDHTHLNLDTSEFADLIPSVEHITRVCHDLLRDPIEAAGGRLASVTVWETDKTSCTYPAEAATL